MISILYLLLFLGKPLGFLAWGGQYERELPKKMRIQSALSIPAQWFAILVLFSLGQVFSLDTNNIIIFFGYIYMAFFFVNAILNFLSKSYYEKMIMTPIALWVSFSFFYLLFLY
jgi:NADH:ubiquinone oxidoreductase subunit 6 (subunit J)